MLQERVAREWRRVNEDAYRRHARRFVPSEKEAEGCVGPSHLMSQLHSHFYSTCNHRSRCNRNLFLSQPAPKANQVERSDGTGEVISLVSDSESDDPVSHTSKPACQPVSGSDARGLNEIGALFTNEDEDLVAEQPLLQRLLPRILHRSTPGRPCHPLRHRGMSSGWPSVSRLATTTPTVNAPDSSPQDSPREPPHPRPRPRPLKQPSVPPDAPGLSDLLKELPVPLVTGDPNPNSLKTFVKSPGADDIESPPSPARKRRRLNKLTLSSSSSSVRWIRPTAVENMGCHHSLWSPRLVREVSVVVSDSQREVKGDGKVVENGYESEEPVEAEEEEEVDELISSDAEGKGNNADDAPLFSPLLPAARRMKPIYLLGRPRRPNLALNHPSHPACSVGC
ncbi:hypothetical protein IMY05_C4547000200 [Salix suchowensis]|nr:hypothetical protein IMY05_C4547000200 [Salix suchowensis]